jgi:hypothetical protein
VLEKATAERKVATGEVAAIVWRQKKQNTFLPTDQRKLYVLTKNNEQIEEISFGDHS